MAIRQRTAAVCVALGLAGAVAGCGDTIAEQGILGAGTGTVAAIALDANPVAGAAIGAAANVAYCKQYPTRC